MPSSSLPSPQPTNSQRPSPQPTGTRPDSKARGLPTLNGAIRTILVGTVAAIATLPAQKPAKPLVGAARKAFLSRIEKRMGACDPS